MPEQTIDDWDQFFREASPKSDLLAEKYPRIPKETLEAMESIDPAKGKSLEWMARQLNSNTIRWPEDSNRLKQALVSFWQIKKSPRKLAQYSANPDLSTYTMQTLETLDDQVRGVIEKPESLTEIPQDTQKIYDDGDISVIKVNTIEAACDLARGTKWCTSDPLEAEDYIKNKGGLYIWFKSGKKFAQSSGRTFLGLRDESLEVDAKLGGIFYKLFKKVPDGISERIPEYEAGLIEDPWEALTYVRKLSIGRLPAAEATILTEPYAALDYARFVIKERWPEAEPIILTEPDTAYYYVDHVIEDRWPEAEPIILKDALTALLYAKDMMKKRWPEAEPIILKSSYGATMYAQYVIKGRWPEAEPKIFSEPEVAEGYVEFLKELGIPDPREKAVVNKAFTT